MTEIGYKIMHRPSFKYKNRAGGTLWSTQGDIYYSLKRARAVIKAHLKHAPLDRRDEDQYQIHEFVIQRTGKIL